MQNDKETKGIDIEILEMQQNVNFFVCYCSYKLDKQYYMYPMQALLRPQWGQEYATDFWQNEYT